MPNKPSSTHRTPTDEGAAARVAKLTDPTIAYQWAGPTTEHRHDGGKRERHVFGDMEHHHDDDGTPVFPDPDAAKTQPLAARPPTGDDADPTPATSAHSEDATPAAMGMDAVQTDVPLGSASVGSGGTAGAGRPLQTMPTDPTDPERTMPVDPSQAPAVHAPAELERADSTIAGAMFAGVPGSAVGDVATISATLTILGFPTEVQHEMTWAQIAMANLARIIEQDGHTRQPADPRLVNGAYDAVMQLAKARGLA